MTPRPRSAGPGGSPGAPAPAALQVVDDLEHAATLLHPVRVRLLRLLREPGSASQLARALDLPRQKVNYHLQELHRRALVEHVESRPVRGCVEQLYRAVARSYVLAPGLLGDMGRPEADARDRFSAAYLLATAARLLHDVVALRSRADRAGQRVPTATVEARVRVPTPAARAALLEELASAVAQVLARHHVEDAPGGRDLRVVLAAHPEVSP